VDVIATIRQRLLSIDALRTLVAGRVHSGQLPQSPALPAVVVQLIPSEVQSGHLRGGVSPRRSRVQVTSVAQSLELAVAVDAAVQGDNAGSGLSYWRGTMGSPSADVRGAFPDTVTGFWDPGELRQYRLNRDYWVHHS
jgi:hypothetical protein